MSLRGDQRAGKPRERSAGTSRRRLASPPLIALLSIAFVITTLPASSRAEDTSSTPTSSVTPSQYDSICRETLNASPSPDDLAASQKLSYCQAAASSKEGYDAGKVLFPVWTGVAVICTAQCALSFTPYALTGAGEYVCAGASALGGVTSGIVTKNVMEAFAGIASAGGAIAMNKLMGAGAKAGEGAAAGTGAVAGAGGGAAATAAPAPAQAAGATATGSAPTTATPGATPEAAPAAKSTSTSTVSEGTKTGGKSKPDIGSCLAAGGAALQAVGKFQLMKTSKESLVSSLTEASMLASETTDTASGTTVAASGALTSGSSSSASGAGSDATTSAITDTGTALTPSASCSGSLSTGAILSCATARDSKLPTWAGTPRFANDFQKYTGMSLSQFADQAEGASNGTAAVGAALSRFSGGTASASKLSSALAEAEREIGVSGTGYLLSGSSGSMGGGESGDMDIAGMMSGLMSQLMPKDPSAAGAQQASQGVLAVANATRTRGPSSIAMDPALGIFDRVSYRYLVLSKFGRVETVQPGAFDKKASTGEATSK